MSMKIYFKNSDLVMRLKPINYFMYHLQKKYIGKYAHSRWAKLNKRLV